MAFNPRFNPNGRGKVYESFGSKIVTKCESNEIPCGTKEAFEALFGNLPEGFFIDRITDKRVILKRG